VSAGLIPSRGRRKRGRRGKKSRVGIHHDLTPMVDIAFLLLIFYMVTTVFSMPHVLEVVLPPNTNDTIPMPPQNLVTIRVDGQNNFYWNIGLDLPRLMRADSLMPLLYGLNRDNPKMTTLIVIHKKADVSAFVDILDDIEMVERAINKDIATEYGLSPDVLTDRDHPLYDTFRERRFSYRYSRAMWEDSDSRRIQKSIGGSL